jgi:ABC-type nitrate/sulfonate/bicarbonate transport system substrate-binding protein
VIKEILRKAKIDPDKDVEWVIGGNQGKRMSAIVADAIDAGLFSPPSDSRLKSQGYNDLAFTPDYYPELTLSAEAVNRDWAQKNGDALRAVLRAELKAVQWLNDPANKAKAIDILVKESGSSVADAEEAYKYYIGQHVWTDACIHQPGLVNTVKIMRAMDQLKILTEADVPKFTDTEWCAK